MKFVLIFLMFLTIGCSKHDFVASGSTEHTVSVVLDMTVALEFCEILCEDDPEKQICMKECTKEYLAVLAEIIGNINFNLED